MCLTYVSNIVMILHWLVAEMRMRTDTTGSWMLPKECVMRRETVRYFMERDVRDAREKVRATPPACRPMHSRDCRGMREKWVCGAKGRSVPLAQPGGN